MHAPADTRVLVIDGDTLFLEIVQYNLTRAGYNVETVADPRVGLRRVMQHEFDLILLDLMMPGLHGEELLELLKPLSLQHKVIVVSAHAEEIFRSHTRDLGATAYLQKPVDFTELLNLVAEVLEMEPSKPNRVTASEETGFLGKMAGWVFEDGGETTAKRWSSLAVVVFLVCVAGWLLYQFILKV
jgi:DNA-binding response OmpR family regulator